jgi:hypothetical protein
MNGEYKERLPFGVGDLIVTKERYYIQFYFSGPDLRYNGTLIRIEKNEIDEYIEAFQKNWEKYLELDAMRSILGNNFSTVGLLKMDIRVGDLFNGVFIRSYHLPLRSEFDIKSIVESLCWAKSKGPEIMNRLFLL